MVPLFSAQPYGVALLALYVALLVSEETEFYVQVKAQLFRPTVQSKHALVLTQACWPNAVMHVLQSVYVPAQGVQHQHK